jgi:hypothetical protein
MLKGVVLGLKDGWEMYLGEAGLGGPQSVNLRGGENQRMECDGIK